MGKTCKKSNELIYAFNNGSLLADKLFIIGLQITTIDNGNHAVLTSYGSTIKKDLNLSSNSVYKRIKKLCNRESRKDSFYDWTMAIRDRKSGRVKIYTVISEATFEKGILSVTYNNELTKYIVNLKNNYTLLNFTDVLGLSTLTSYRLYEILKAEYDNKRHAGSTVFEFNLSELKLMLGAIDFEIMPLITEELEKDCPDYDMIADIAANSGFDRHVTYQKFNGNILSKAVSELNVKTGLLVEYVPIKAGKKVVGIRFFVNANPNMKRD